MIAVNYVRPFIGFLTGAVGFISAKIALVVLAYFTNNVKLFPS